MTLSEYLECAIVGDRVRVTYAHGESYVGYTGVSGRLVFAIRTDAPAVVLGTTTGWADPHVTDVERLPLGVPA